MVNQPVTAIEARKILRIKPEHFTRPLIVEVRGWDIDGKFYPCTSTVKELPLSDVIFEMKDIIEVK